MTSTQLSIASLEVFVVPLAVKSVRAHGIGSISGDIEVVLLRLEDSAGHVGWGEAAPWAPFAGTPEAGFAALDRYLSPIALAGGDRPQMVDQANHALAGHSDAKAAFETALLDLEGQILGKPIWALLGQKTRETVPLSISIADPDWSRDLDLISRATDAGIKTFKFKAGFDTHAFDLMRIEQTRDRFGDGLNLRLDYNQGLTPDQAMERVSDLDTLGLDFIEQPVRAKEWEAMATFQMASATPLLADESVFDGFDLVRAVRDEIANAVSIKIMKAGGPAQGHALGRNASNLGWRTYGGDMFETGIAHLAGLHMIAASDDFAWGCEFYHANWHLKRDLLAERFPEENGAVVVPDMPGLGVAVDEDRIRQTATNHARHTH